MCGSSPLVEVVVVVVAMPFDRGLFFAANQGPLCDNLAPHLSASDLATLARVARTFRAWPTLARRKCRLACRRKLEVHGYVDNAPVMKKKRCIEMHAVMLELFTDANGFQRRRLVSPSAQVDFAKSLVSVDLVCERTGVDVENLLRGYLFKHHSRGRKETHGYRWRKLRFKIAETLSSNHPSPGLFRLRTTASVARIDRSGHSAYVHYTRPFLVVGADRIVERPTAR